MVRTATPADEAAATGALLLAFASDPATRWIWAAPDVYLAHFPAFAKAFGGKAFNHASAYIAEGGAGAALWLPPGSAPDEDELGELLQRTAPARIRADIPSLLEQMGRHHPSEPHWYLPLIGIDPARQGRGLGSALMRHALVACDRDRLPAYLESANPQNVPFYERLGFERLGIIQVGESPPFFPMLRPARPSAPGSRNPPAA
jgi:ribosomal protein S18 acetylase RimI-like enzyme